MVLSWFQIRKVITFHITVAEALGVVGFVGLAVQINIPVILEDADRLIADIHLSRSAAIHTDQWLGTELEGVLNGRLLGEHQLPLSVHAPPLWLAMKGQLHGRTLISLRFKDNYSLADPHAKEVWLVSVMEHLIAHRRQEPALYGSRPCRKPVKEEGIIGDIQIFEPMLSRLGIVLDDIAILAGDHLQLHVHLRAVIHTWAADIEQEVLTVLPCEG